MISGIGSLSLSIPRYMQRQCVSNVILNVVTGSKFDAAGILRPQGGLAAGGGWQREEGGSGRREGGYAQRG